MNTAQATGRPAKTPSAFASSMASPCWSGGVRMSVVTSSATRSSAKALSISSKVSWVSSIFSSGLGPYSKFSGFTWRPSKGRSGSGHSERGDS